MNCDLSKLVSLIPSDTIVEILAKHFSDSKSARESARIGLGLGEIIAKQTKTTLDDLAIERAKGILENDTYWDIAWYLWSKLPTVFESSSETISPESYPIEVVTISVDDFKDAVKALSITLPVSATDQGEPVYEAIDPITIIMGIQAIITVLQAIRNRRKNAN